MSREADGVAPDSGEVETTEGTSATCRVALIEDDAITRGYLGEVLEAAGLTVVADEARGTSGLRQVVDLAPDVVLVDLHLPDISGIELIEQIQLLAPEVEVLVVTASDERADLVNSIAAGAHGYFVKGSTSQDLVDAVRRIALGEPVLSPGTVGRLVEYVRDRPVIAADEATTAKETMRATLTKRELRILELLAQGKENSEIASELHISPHTVKNHVRNILTKLHLENRVQAAVEAVRSGIA
jgi:DNA-binding NarL/FixJ family response regulator